MTCKGMRNVFSIIIDKDESDDV